MAGGLLDRGSSRCRAGDRDRPNMRPLRRRAMGRARSVRRRAGGRLRRERSPGRACRSAREGSTPRAAAAPSGGRAHTRRGNTAGWQHGSCLEQSADRAVALPAIPLSRSRHALRLPPSRTARAPRAKRVSGPDDRASPCLAAWRAAPGHRGARSTMLHRGMHGLRPPTRDRRRARRGHARGASERASPAENIRPRRLTAGARAAVPPTVASPRAATSAADGKGEGTTYQRKTWQSGKSSPWRSTTRGAPRRGVETAVRARRPPRNSGPAAPRPAAPTRGLSAPRVSTRAPGAAVPREPRPPRLPTRGVHPWDVSAPRCLHPRLRARCVHPRSLRPPRLHDPRRLCPRDVGAPWRFHARSLGSRRLPPWRVHSRKVRATVVAARPVGARGVGRARTVTRARFAPVVACDRRPAAPPAVVRTPPRRLTWSSAAAGWPPAPRKLRVWLHVERPRTGCSRPTSGLAIRPSRRRRPK